jgi:hypothetical protein
MAKNILKEAIADAKAVREVALANAKAALEEAFTPRLQSMLSAKLSETLNEEEEEELEENFMDETMNEMDVEEEIEEIAGMDEEEEGADLDEEIDLEEILNELELEEGAEAEEETVDEAKAEDDEEIEEAVGKPNHKAEYVRDVMHKADDINAGLNEGESFDLDALLEEINNLDETGVEEEYTPGPDHSPRPYGKDGSNYDSMEDWVNALKKFLKRTKGDDSDSRVKNHPHYNIAKTHYDEVGAIPQAAEEGVYEALESELEETKSALNTVRTELNEVNLLNSKLLYVNRIFKANTLDQGQKLRVVETLDKAETAKEAKLIYETIKDTFNVAKSKKVSFKNKTKSLKEGIGMASKAAGRSTAPKKEVIAESDNMVNRFQKLANIKIN